MIVHIFIFVNNPAIDTPYMLTEYLKPHFFRKTILFFLLALIYFLLISGLPVEAQAPKKLVESEKIYQPDFAESLKNNPWADIRGFRSAKFGMDKKRVLKAISKDFKINKDKVKRESSPIEGTSSLELTVPKLFSTGGTAKLGYVFGAKSKKLMHINIMWGNTIAGDVKAETLVHTANLLNKHFAKKRYKPEGLVSNGALSKTSTMVFRGKDKKDRMLLLLLTSPSTTATLTPQEQTNQVRLVLSYIENPENPDVRKIVVGDDDF
jgi:hypothetical protein